MTVTVNIPAPCGTCGRPTTHRITQYVGGRGYQERALCADNEGCGAEYQVWLAERDAQAAYEAETERLLAESYEQRQRTAESFARWVEECSFVGEPWDPADAPDACPEHKAGCPSWAHTAAEAL